MQAGFDEPEQTFPPASPEAATATGQTQSRMGRRASLTIVFEPRAIQEMKWNAGGWFGGQLGSTAWLFVAAAVSLPRDSGTSLILLIIFAVPNALGLFLWSRRHYLSCYRATQLIVIVAGVAGLLAVYVLEQRSSWRAIQTGGSVSTTWAYIAIAAVAITLLVMFHLRFGRSTNGPDA